MSSDPFSPLKNFLRQLRLGALHFLPPLCYSCEKSLSSSGDEEAGFPFFCESCFVALPWASTEHSCRHCGGYTAESSRLFCALCSDRGFAFDSTFCSLWYEDPVSHWIPKYKFHYQEKYARMLGYLLAWNAKKRHFNFDLEAIVPVPLHPKRLKQRGFNQAWHLAKFSIPQNIPLQSHWLTRIRNTVPQTRLNANKRKENVAQAFLADSAVKGKRIGLLDDVMTTGATLHEATLALKTAGAAHVQLITLARSKEHQDLNFTI